MESPTLYDSFTKELTRTGTTTTQDIDLGQSSQSSFLNTTSIASGSMMSGTYEEGVSGWKLDADGNLYANNGTFKGDITGATGTFTGTVTVGSLNIPDTTTANSFHVDTTGNAWWGATAIGSAVAKVLNTGAATFTNITATGTINATAGYVGSATALVYESQGINCGVDGHIRGGQTSFKAGNGFYHGYDSVEELEQYYYVTSNIGDYIFADGTTGKIGQGFSLTDGQTTVNTIKVYLKMKTNGETHTNPITCDLYLMDNSTLLPTGASLGQASIAGISNGAYEEKTFTFASPITVSSTNNYVFVLESADDAGDGIHAKYHNAPNGAYSSGQMVRYQAAWLALGVGTDLAFEVYSKYTGYKLSFGNTTNQLSYNTQFVDTTGSFIVRSTTFPDTFSKLGSTSLSFISGGVNNLVMNTSGINYYLKKTLSIGTLTYCTIAPYAASGATNDVWNAGVGVRITEGRTSATLDFTDNGLVVSNGVFSTIGSAASKQTVYCNALSACPLPSTDNALDLLDKMPNPKTKEQLKDPKKAHFEYKNPLKKRKYFDIPDVPNDLKFINNEKEEDIELIRVIGFCFEAIKELNQEIKTLKQKIK